MSIKITAHGHATFSLNVHGTDIVIDPYFAGNNPAAVKPVSDVLADYILITHGHRDHVQDAVALAQAGNAPVIANQEIAAWIRAHGHQNTMVIARDQNLELPFGRLRMTAADHGSNLPDGSDGGKAGGYIIFATGGTIYFAGDTALFPEMAKIGDAELDVAVIPAGGHFTMDPDQAFAALTYLRPKVVIPCHYNTFPQIAQDMGAWAKRVAAETAVQTVLLNPEESYEL